MCHHQKTTYLTCVGDAKDPSTWSGTPYHFLEAGRRIGLIDEGLSLGGDGRNRTLQRILWNSATVLRGRRHGGFQYSNWFLENLYAPFQNRLAGNRAVNCFQMYPLSIVRNPSIEKWFYIDMTLRQLFDFYGAKLDNRTAADAMQREGDGYHAAQGVFTLSQWAADSVVCDYGVRPEKVRAVVPGANVDPDIYSHWFSQTPYRPIPSEQPLRLVFVGKYWRRKGLDRLMGAFQIARERGANFTLRIIGVDRESAPRAYGTVSGVEWKAFLDKRVSAVEFLDAVSECDVGCLLSRADASPIAVREYCALGLVTLCTNAGGSLEMAVPEASISVPVDASDESIAETLLRLCGERSRFERMRKEAWRHRQGALWGTTVTRMLNFMQTAIG